MPNNYKNAWRDSAKKNNTTKTAQDIRLCAKRTRNATAKVVDARGFCSQAPRSASGYCNVEKETANI